MYAAFVFRAICFLFWGLIRVASTLCLLLLAFLDQISDVDCLSLCAILVFVFFLTRQSLQIVFLEVAFVPGEHCHHEHVPEHLQDDLHVGEVIRHRGLGGIQLLHYVVNVVLAVDFVVIAPLELEAPLQRRRALTFFLPFAICLEREVPFKDGLGESFEVLKVVRFAKEVNRDESTDESR